MTPLLRTLLALALAASAAATAAGGLPGNGYTAHGVHGTMWAASTDEGGCEMPTTEYAVDHAVALGDEEEMGLLSADNANHLCGHVVSVHCGGKAVRAVVASVCNKGARNCGVDMISRTWPEATGGKIPGIEKCKVELTDALPMASGSPKCFFRPSSTTGNPHFASVGVFNTGGRLPVRATLGEHVGTFNGVSGYFDFRGHVGVHTGSSKALVTHFSDGSSHSVPFRDCAHTGSTYIWSRRLRRLRGE